MKINAILLSLSLVVATTSSFGQIRTYGIKLGAIAAKQTWQYSSPFGQRPTVNRWGVDVGIFLEWPSISFISISTEVHFTERGMAEEFRPINPLPEGSGNIITFSREIDYLSLPVLFKIRYDGDEIELYALTGPRLDVKLGTREQPDLPYEGFRDVGLGLTFGGGIIINRLLSGHDLGLELRLSPTFGSEYSTPDVDVTSKSMELLFVLEL